MTPSSKPVAPVVAHHTWRFLLRELARAHPVIVQGSTAHNLQYVLKPAASLAWWIHTYRAELLERPVLNLVLAGCGIQEAVDGGRWWSFLPWCLGRPDLKVNVTLVGDQMVGLDERSGTFRSSQGASQARLEQDTRSPMGHLVKALPAANLVGGQMGDWFARSESLSKAVQNADQGSAPDSDLSSEQLLEVAIESMSAAVGEVDLLVLFSPGFESHYDTWLTWHGLLPFLTSATPTACFAYSALDQASDVFALGACGLKVQSAEARDNPWADEANNARMGVGCFAAKAWSMELRAQSIEFLKHPQPQAFVSLPFVDERMQAWHMVQRCIEHEFRMEGDICIERLGSFVDTKARAAAPGSTDALCRLPDGWAVHCTNRQVFKWEPDDKLFVPVEPRIEVPAEFFEGRPVAPGEMVERAIWAVAMHMAHVTPQMMAPFYDVWNANPRPPLEQTRAAAGPKTSVPGAGSGSVLATVPDSVN